jgi:hypothetical protein
MEKIMKVLISPGYGAGWSTWNYIDLAFDPDIIQAFEAGLDEEDMRLFIISLGYEEPYMGGYDCCKVVDIPKGTKFKIREYDGSEYIETYKEKDWLVAL